MSIRAASRTTSGFTAYVRRPDPLYIPPAEARSGTDPDDQDDSSRRARRDVPGLTFSTSTIDEDDDDGTYSPVPPNTIRS